LRLHPGASFYRAVIEFGTGQSSTRQNMPFQVKTVGKSRNLRYFSFFGRYWLKSVQPDFRLLTIKEMRVLFPDAEIVLERYCGFVKSIVAIKS